MQTQNEELIEFGRKLFAKDCRFVIGVAKLDQIPAEGMPEIAFAGRSNVGKSSLVNALTGRKTLARASNTPGRTQQLNFFVLDERLSMVDLPGYGFAEAPKSTAQNWQRMIFSYLRGRSTLRRVCLLVDSRHGIKKNDLEVMKLLDEAAVSYQVVLTKADKIKEKEQEKVLAQTKAEIAKHPAAFPEVFLTSSEKRQGIEEVRASIGSIVLEAEERSL